MFLTLRPAGAVLCLGALVAAPAAEARVSCGKWNTVSFFEAASARDTARCLRRGRSPNARDRKHGAGPLHRAAALGRYPGVIRALVAAGARIGMRDRKKKTPLHWAATYSKTPGVVRALLRAGADIRARDQSGYTVLHSAASNSRSPAVVRTLIEAGAVLNARTVRRLGSLTPLHIAAIRQKDMAVTKVLLRAGADPNARAGRRLASMTPLHMAARTGKTSGLLNALLDAGADARVRDRRGKTASDYIRGNRALRYSSAARRLRRAMRHPPRRTIARRPAGPCAGWNTQRFFETATADDVAKCLGAAGKSVNTRDAGNGGTPLHRAAAYSNTPAVVQALLKAGADLHAKSNSGSTPLHWAAAYSKSPAAIEALLAAGADPAAKNGKGKLPADLIAENRALRGSEVARTLAVARPDTGAVAVKSTETRKESTKAGAKKGAAAGTGTCGGHWRVKRNGVPDWPHFFATATGADVADCILTGRIVADRNYKHNIKSFTGGASYATPLHWAAGYSERPVVVAALVKAGANIEARSTVAIFGSIRKSPSQTPLHWAASHGNPALVAALVKAGADPDARDTNGNTPLHLAAGGGETPAIVAALLDAGAKGLRKNNARQLPYQLIARNRHLKNSPVAARLWRMAAVSCERWPTGAKAKSSKNANDLRAFFMAATPADVTHCLRKGAINLDGHYFSDGFRVFGKMRYFKGTPLHWAAAYSRNPEVVKTLLKAGADIDAKTEGRAAGIGANTFIPGQTPLHWAARLGRSPAVLTALIGAGANAAAKDSHGKLPADYITGFWLKGCPHKFVTNLKRLCGDFYNAGNRHLKDSDIEQRLRRSEAVACGAWNTTKFFENAIAVDVANCLQNDKTRVHAQHKDGTTPLHLAGGHTGDPAVVATLIEAGADIAARSRNGATPLHRAAARSGKPDVVAALLKAGADAGEKDKEGSTPLHLVARYGKAPAVVAALVKAGADAEAKDKKGNTPLHIAARYGKAPAVVAALFKAGVNADARDKKGNTPLHIAARYSKTPAMAAALAKAGADVNARRRNGWTPLHAAAVYGGDSAVLATLVEAGADANARDNNRWTPLHWAVQAGAGPALVAALLDAGADAAARNGDGAVPWDLVDSDSSLKGTDAARRLRQGKTAAD